MHKKWSTGDQSSLDSFLCQKLKNLHQRVQILGIRKRKNGNLVILNFWEKIHK